MMNKTLIAYTSKSGATKEASEVIADALRVKHNFEVDLVDLRKSSPNIKEYVNVVVGALGFGVEKCTVKR